MSAASLKAYAEQKSNKLTRYYDRIQEIEIVFDNAKDAMQVEMIVNAEHRNMFIAHDTRRTPMPASTAASTSSNGSYRNTRRNSAIGNIPAATTNMKCAEQESRTEPAGRGEPARQSRKIDGNERAAITMKLMDFIVAEAIVPQLAATRPRRGASRTGHGAGQGRGPAGFRRRRDRRRAGQAGAERLHRFRQGHRRPAREAPDGQAHGRYHRPQRRRGSTLPPSIISRFSPSSCCLSPENQPQQHLQAMNIVFSNLQKDMFRRFLRQSATREAIVDLLQEADQRP